MHDALPFHVHTCLLSNSDVRHGFINMAETSHDLRGSISQWRRFAVG